MKPKLLVVTSTFPRWQNDTDPPFVYELSRRLTPTFDITVHTPHYHGSNAREMMDGMQIHRFRYFLPFFERLAGGQGIVPTLRHNKFYYLLVPFFLSAQFFSLLLLVASAKPDVIHAHWLLPQGLVAVLIKRLCGIPVVVTAHGTDVFSLRQRAFVLLKKFIINNANSIVTVSKSLAEVLVADTDTAIQPEIIPMGVDATIFTPKKKDREIRERYDIDGPFLLFVGRLTEVKGVRYLIDAMSLVVAEVPGAKLLIVGHGELEDELKEKVNDLQLQDFIFFTGGIANQYLPAYYATADIFIGPSIQTKRGDTEGFGITFVEAAMSGCLLIGTRTGGIGEIIVQGHTGFLVPPANVRRLADVVLYALSNPDKINEIINNGKTRCYEKYDWGVISQKYSTTFNLIINN